MCVTFAISCHSAGITKDGRIHPRSWGHAGGARVCLPDVEDECRRSIAVIAHVINRHEGVTSPRSGNGFHVIYGSRFCPSLVCELRVCNLIGLRDAVDGAPHIAEYLLRLGLFSPKVPGLRSCMYTGLRALAPLILAQTGSGLLFCRLSLEALECPEVEPLVFLHRA
jgi:hypothetical protein